MAGNLASVTDANNATTVFTYDADNRLKTRNAPGVLDDLDVDYDGAGRIRELAGGGATTTFTYDTHGRLQSRTDIVNGVTFGSAYAYNATTR